MFVVDNDSIWAMAPYSYKKANVQKYSELANEYKRQLGDSVNVWLMPIPPHAAFYMPSAAYTSTNPQLYSTPVRPAMLDMFAVASDSVTCIDIYKALGEHARQPIYSRTDHHWLPLGAYHAAGELARALSVPFRSLDSYNPVTIPGFVGTMSRYSRDPRVKANPENFTYYVPQDTAYKVNYINYDLSKNRKSIAGVRPEKEDPLFIKTSLGASYSTFGGGDAKIIKVTGENPPNHRRLLLIKDSFGNALTPFLIGSFEQVHVVDSRFFHLNIKDYIRDNGITDVVLCNSMQLGSTDRILNNIAKYLIQ